MTPTATAIPTELPARAGGLPATFHIAAAVWVAGMLALAALLPLTYEDLLQEDRFVEWWTVALFAAAAWFRLRSALPARRWFDILVGLFCVFVAGEEFSWGQRLLGFTPPAPFLEHNFQQEFTLHNFRDTFGQPRGVLMLALGGYALLALAGTVSFGRRLLSRLRATPPPLAAVPWLLAAVALLAWYPAEYTGEWVEALAGATFMVSAPRARPGRSAVITAALALLLALYSGWSRPANADLECARAEAFAILEDLQRGAADITLRTRDSVHKRLFSAIEDGYVQADSLHAFRTTPCSENAATRRRHGLDPWGMAYWIRTERVGRAQRSLTVYSMGPNRRRDGDDVGMSGVLE